MSNRRPSCTSILTICGAMALAGGAHGQSLDAEVRLEGSGKHREECNAMQLKPFDFSLLSKLTDWSGTPVTAESAAGKVVVILTWTSFAKSTNSPAANVAQKLQSQMADKGLIVVGVHNPRGFESAKGVAGELGLTFPYGADATGEVRTGLKADQDPDFFVIDRAGNMRFADVETSAVQRAAEICLGETLEAAKEVPLNVSKAADAARAAKMKTRDVAGAVKPGQPLTVPYNPPSDEEYAKAKWPTVVTKTGSSQYDQMAEKIRKERPVLGLNDEGWVSTKPVSTGRVTLVYVIDPMNEQTKGAVTKMARLQEAHVRDLVVVATLPKPPDAGDATEEEKQASERRRLENAKKFAREMSLNHGLNTSLLKMGDQDTEVVMLFRMRHEAVTYFLVSSDGRIRNCGNPYWEGFETKVSEFIETDPGVAARRKAEQAAAKAQTN